MMVVLPKSQDTVQQGPRPGLHPAPLRDFPLLPYLWAATGLDYQTSTPVKTGAVVTGMVKEHQTTQTGGTLLHPGPASSHSLPCLTHLTMSAQVLLQALENEEEAQSAHLRTFSDLLCSD